MDYSPILDAVNFDAVTAGVVLVFAALAGLLVVLAGGRFLLDAISGDEGDDEEADDEQAREDFEEYTAKQTEFDED